MIDLSLFQAHTVELYDLASKSCSIQKVKARTLLTVRRFDLFAKLFYARNRVDNPELAIDVYLKHIKAFNPDGKEPGRDDKTTFRCFVETFDSLLDYFQNNEFDESKSIVPVSSDGIILDGGHRIAALAFYDKEVTIAVFDGVKPVCHFDNLYFKKRGLPQNISDIVANEILQWKSDCLVACLWPRMGTITQKETAINLLKENTTLFYQKTFDVNLKALTLFVAKVYRKQSWVGTEKNGYIGAMDKALNCYERGNTLDLCFFATEQSHEDILLLKDRIRELFPYDKHSIHITDDFEETKDIAYYALESDGIDQWAFAGNVRGWQLLKMRLSEKLYIFKHTTFIKLKSYLASIIRW